MRDQLHDREVALKVLSSDYASALGSARFLREIRLASRLQHPYIVPVLDSGEWEGWLYYVMPVIEGHPLRVRMTRERQLPVEDAVRYTMEIADALQHAHQRGVLHRDVKPENILISGQHACLADFGIARAITPATDDRITTTGVILGTPAYMSPEQASSDGAIDGRSDQYALGCVLFEMLAGVPPFVGPTEQSVIMQRFHHAAPKARQYRPELDPMVEEVVRRALHLTPADRFPSMGAFSSALRSGVEKPSTGDWSSGKTGLAARLGGRRRQFVALAVLLVAVAGGLGAWRKFSDESDFLTANSEANLTLNSARDPGTIVVLGIDASGLELPQRESARYTTDLTQALGKWSGLPLLSLERAQRVRLTGSIPADSLPALRKRALAEGATHMIWGIAEPVGDSTRISARLLEARTGQEVKATTVMVPSGEHSPLTGLAATLMRPRELVTRLIFDDTSTRSFPAWVAFGKGRAAAGRGALSEAESLYSVALSLDGQYADVRLHRALLHLENSGDGVLGAGVDLLHSMKGLSASREHVARALGLLGERQFDNARVAAESAVQSDSSDALAWILLGDAHLRDDRVVSRQRNRDVISRFASSYRAAAMAYRRALLHGDEFESSVAFRRLSLALFVEPNRIRLGRHDSKIMAAFPALDSDTLAFFPSPVERLSDPLPARSAASRDAAIARNRAFLLEAALEWVRREPQSSPAWEALALSREATGDLAPVADERGSAMSAIRIAQRLADAPDRRARLAIQDVRFRVKSYAFKSARNLADSLLTHTTAPPRPVRASFAALATLIGREELAVEHWLASGKSLAVGLLEPPRPVPDELRAAAIRLLVGAALGYCSNQLESLLTSVRQSARAFAGAGAYDTTAGYLTDWSASMMVPCTRGASARDRFLSNDPLLELQRVFATQSADSARRALRNALEGRQSDPIGDVAIDVGFQQAWLAVALGDTTLGVHQMVAFLNALPSTGISLTDEPTQAATVGRLLRELLGLPAHLRPSFPDTRLRQLLDELIAHRPYRR